MRVSIWSDKAESSPMASPATKAPESGLMDLAVDAKFERTVSSQLVFGESTLSEPV